MREYYPELATPDQWNNEFSGLVFYGEQQKGLSNFQQGQENMIENTFNTYSSFNDISNNRYYAPQSNYVNGNCNSNPYPQFTSLKTIQEEKRKLNHFEAQVKQEFTGGNFGVDNLQHLSSSLPDIRNISSSDDSDLQENQEIQRPKSLSHPPVTASESCNPKIKKIPSRPRMYKFNPRPLTLNPQMKRSQTPSDNKNDEYWEKRKKNNEASRRSRMARRLKECMVMEEMKKLKKENEDLKAELRQMQNAVVSCRM